MSEKQSVLRKAIPLCGIVLVLGMVSCNWDFGIAFVPPPKSKQAAHAGTPGEKEIVALVQDFLKNVPANKRETYDLFFADDVIYTRNSGQVVTKKDILAGTGNPSADRAQATFSGEDFTVHQYGEMAVVNFKLVMHPSDAAAATRSFRNTGTFLKRNGQWQVVAWQATPIAEEQAQH